MVPLPPLQFEKLPSNLLLDILKIEVKVKKTCLFRHGKYCTVDIFTVVLIYKFMLLRGLLSEKQNVSAK